MNCRYPIHPTRRQRIMAMGIALAGGIESNAGLFCLDLKAVKCTESGQLLPGGEHWGSKVRLSRALEPLPSSGACKHWLRLMMTLTEGV